jgi:hypothetical protein
MKRALMNKRMLILKAGVCDNFFAFLTNGRSSLIKKEGAFCI